MEIYCLFQTVVAIILIFLIELYILYIQTYFLQKWDPMGSTSKGHGLGTQVADWHEAKVM